MNRFSRLGFLVLVSMAAWIGSAACVASSGAEEPAADAEASKGDASLVPPVPTAPGPITGDAGGDAPTDSADPPIDSGYKCNSVPQLGKDLTVTQVAGEAPQGLGGSITPGTYVLTARKTYGSVTAANLGKAETIALSLPFWESVIGPTGKGTDARVSYSLKWRENYVNATSSCDSLDEAHVGLGFSATYTVSGTTFIAYVQDDGGGIIESTYTKQ